jgi:hypothetical protein
LFERPAVFDDPGFKGCEQRSGELNVGEPFVAEARIAFVMVPTRGKFDPLGCVGEGVIRNTVPFARRPLERARGVAVVVTGETTVLFRPGRDLARQEPDGSGFGVDVLRLRVYW